MATDVIGLNLSFPIRNEDGTLFNGLVLHKATYDSVVMSLADKITGDVYYKDNGLQLTMREYVEYNGVKFVIVNPPTILKEGIVSDNSELKGMTKYSFEFYHPMYVLSNIPFTDVAVSADQDKYLSQNKTFSWIGTCYDFIAKLNKNLEGTQWVVVPSGDQSSNEMMSQLSDVLSFDNQYIGDALKTSYETWGVPFVIDTIQVGEYRDEQGRDYFSLGKRYAIVIGEPANEIIDYDSKQSSIAVTDVTTGSTIPHSSTTVTVQANRKFILESLDDDAYPLMINASNYGVVGTSSRTFQEDATIYIASSKVGARIRYFYDDGQGNPFVFNYGQGVGLKNNSRTPRNNKIITRLSGYGSEENIPYGYPQIVWSGSEDDPRLQYPLYKGIAGGRYVTLIKHPFTRNHLMPSVYTESLRRKIDPTAQGYDPTTELVDYYDAVYSQEYPYENEINPSSPSYESHQFEDIKPELDSSSSLTILNAFPINDGDLQPADKWIDDIDDEGNYKQGYFKITLPILGFDLYACASITEEMKINMRGGACIGCTFEIQVDWDDYKKNFYDEEGNFVPDGAQRDLTKYPKSNQGSISVIVKKETSTFGTLMPNIYQQPKNGDLFVILGISLPLSYITDAEHRLDAKVKRFMLDNNTYYFDYPLKFDEYFLAKRSSILAQIRPNTVVRFNFKDEPMSLYVKQLTVKYGDKPLPQYNITLTDKIEVVLNQIGKVEGDISNLASSVASMKRNQGGSGSSGGADNTKLSRISDDTAQGEIGFLKGLWIKAKGLFGWNENGDISANNGTFAGDASVGGDANIGGNATIGGNGSVGKDFSVGGIFTAIEGKINKLRSHNYSGSGLGDSGWQLTNDDGNGNSLLEVDNLLVRMKATFMELEIRKETFMGGNSHYSPAGSVVFKVDYIKKTGEKIGYREQRVPWLLKGMAFLFGNKSYTRKKYIRYANTYDQLTEDEKNQVAKFRLYLISDDGTTATRNWWQVGDQPRCQSFNKAASRENKKTHPYDSDQTGDNDPSTPMASDFWWRLITEVGSEEGSDGKMYDWIELPNEHFPENEDEYQRDPDSFCAEGSGLPQAGDTIVCMGNRFDQARMNLVSIISVATDYSDAPAVKGWRGIHTFSFDGCIVFQFSPSKVRMLSNSFEWITDNGEFLPPVLERGDYVAGERFHYNDRVARNGSLWLCIVSDTKVWIDASGNSVSEPSEMIDGEGIYDYTVTLPGMEEPYHGTDRYYRLGKVNGETVYYVRNWTYDEPVDTSALWHKEVSKGKDGTEITEVIISYAASQSGTTAPLTGWKVVGTNPGEYATPDAAIAATGISAGKYLWTRTQTYYSDGRTPVVEFTCSRWGIDGDGIDEMDSLYWATTAIVSMPAYDDGTHITTWDASATKIQKRGMWAPTFGDLTAAWDGLGEMQGMYVWEKTVVKYDQPAGQSVQKPDVVSYKCSRIGQDGQIGQEEYYCLLSSADFATAFKSSAPTKNQIGIVWENQSLPSSENYRLAAADTNNPNICTNDTKSKFATTTPVWSPTRPNYVIGSQDKYLWNFEQRVDGMGTEYATKPVCIGDASRGIAGVIELYALSVSQTPKSASILIPDDLYQKNGYGTIPTSGFDDKKVWGDEEYDRAPTEALPYQWNWTRTLYTTPKDASDTARYVYNGVSYPYEDHYHVSAVKGTRGEDGAGEESIFLRSETEITFGNASSAHPKPSVVTTGTIPDPEHPGQRKEITDVSQIATTDDFVPTGWSDNPQGITSTYKFEYVSTRKLGSPDAQGRKTWGEFSDPVLRSNWGKNGVDGDGTEYVFMRTKNYVAPIIAYPNVAETSPVRTYLDDDYLPTIANNDSTRQDGTKAWAESNRCTDNPKDISREWPFEWCIKRTKDAPSTADATYGKREWKQYGGTGTTAECTMSLWKNYAESLVHLDIDNEMDMVQTDSALKVTTTRVVSTKVNLWDGSKKASMTVVNVNVTVKDEEGNTVTLNPSKSPSSGTTTDLVLSWTFTAGDTMKGAYEITIGYSYTADGITFPLSSVFTIAASKGLPIMQLKPSHSALPCTRNASNNTLNNPPALSLSVIKIDGESSSEQQALPNPLNEYNVVIRYAKGASATMPSSKDDTRSSDWPATNSLQALPTDKNVYIAMFDKTSGVLLDRETVPVICDGENGDGITSVGQTYNVSKHGTSASDTTAPTDCKYNEWQTNSPSVDEEYPYLWKKEVTGYKYSSNVTKYYCMGARGDNGIDAQDVEWAYIRTTTNVPPVIADDTAYTDSNGNDYTVDDHLPHVTGDSHVENNHETYECTDDPKGVSSTWKYEWEIKRKKGEATNGHRQWLPYSGTMTLHNSLAESALVIDIDNDNDQFGVDSDGKVLVQQTRSTNVTMIYGTVEQAFTEKPTASLKYDDGTAVASTVAEVGVENYAEGKTSYAVTVTFKATGSNSPVFGSSGKNGVYVVITGKCAKGTQSVRFTLEKVMSGASGVNPVIYQLALSQKSYSYGRDASNSLVAKSNSVTVNLKVTEGSTSTIYTSSNISQLTNAPKFSWGYDSGSAQASNQTIGTTITIAPSNVGTHTKVWFLLTTGDKEEVPIVTDGANGSSISKVSETSYYAVSTSGTTQPTQDGDESAAAVLDKWYTTRDKVASLWTSNRWLWIKTDIEWSDNSHTYLYTNERNPNDGQPGQDIVNGTTVFKYACTENNTAHPADDSSEWKDYNQVAKTKGWWLWSWAKTPYYKANDLDTPIGYSSNYSVTYIGTDGDSVSAQYAPNSSPTSSQIHSTFQTGDKYMRTMSTSDATWSAWQKIVGEDGENGDYIDSSFAISAKLTTANVNTAPSDVSSWSDAPVATTTSKPYLWCKQVSHTFSGGTETTGTPTYFRMTGENGTDADVWTIGSDGYWYKNGIKQSTKAEGKDGTGVEIEGGVDKYYTTSGKTSLQSLTGMDIGDCYIVNDDSDATHGGHLYYYTGEGSWPSNWRDLGKIKGESGTSSYMHIAYADDVTFDASGNPTSCTGFTVTKEKEAYDWIGLCTNDSVEDPTTYTSYEWNKVKGPAGRAINSVSEHYKASKKDGSSSAQSESKPIADGSTGTEWNTDPNLSGDTNQWSEAYPYLWNYERTEYSSGTSPMRTTPHIVAKWTKNGANGRGIDSITNHYAISASGTLPTGGNWPTDISSWDDNPIPPTDEKPYLWNYETITWLNSDGSTINEDILPAHVVGHYGSDGDTIRQISVYKKSETQPAAPVATSVEDGATVVANGWTVAPPSDTGFSDIHVDNTGLNTNIGTMTVWADMVSTDPNYETFGSGWRIAKGNKNDGSNSKYVVDRIKFTPISNSETLRLEIAASAEMGYDGVLVGELNTAATASTNWNTTSNKSTDRKSVKQIVSIDVTVSGHANEECFVDIVFKKDGSQHTNDDCGYYRILSVVSTGNQIWESEATLKNTIVQSPGWSDPVKWNGKDGDDGKDAAQVVFDPPIVAVPSDEDGYCEDGYTGYVNVLLMLNGSPITLTDLTVVSGPTGVAATASLDYSRITVEVTADDSADYEGGVVVSASGTSNGVTYTARGTITVVANRQGASGGRGKTGRFYYYAGEYSGTPSDYSMEQTQAPFVKYGDSFWMLDFKGIEPSTLPASSTDVPGVNSESWTLMSSEQQYYIAKAVFGDYAQFGGFCINGDWHISTYGKILNTPYNTSNWDNPSVFTGTNTNDKATAYLTFDPSIMPSGVKKLYGKKDINGTSYTSISISPSNGMRIIRVTGKALGTATLYLRISHGSYTRELTITGDTKSVFFVFNVNGSVTLQAKMSVSNTTGTIFYVDQVSFVPEYAVDGKTGRNYSHDISLTGSLSAKNVLRNVLFYWYENDAHLYYYSKNVYYINGINDWVETSGYSVGMYVMEDEVSNDSGFDTTNLVYNTYDADVVVCMFGYADATVGTFVGPTLPRPEDFLGKMVEIYSSMYSGTGKMRIYVVGEGCLCRKIYRDGSCEMYGPFAYLDVTVGVPVKAIAVKVNNKYRWLILEQFISAYGGESASFNPNNKTSLTFQNGLFQSAT